MDTGYIYIYIYIGWSIINGLLKLNPLECHEPSDEAFILFQSNRFPCSNESLVGNKLICYLINSTCDINLLICKRQLKTKWLYLISENQVWKKSSKCLAKDLFMKSEVRSQFRVDFLEDKIFYYKVDGCCFLLTKKWRRRANEWEEESKRF